MDHKILVHELTWDTYHYIKGKLTSTTVQEEVERIVFEVIRDTISNVSFSFRTCTMDFYKQLNDSIVSTILFEHKAGRYVSPSNMLYVMNKAHDYLWNLLQMDDFYKED